MLQSVDVKTLTPEIFSVFGTQNALLTAGDRERYNTMTIGWCGLGRLWNLPACTVFVRPGRFTYSFMEMQEQFSVSVLPASMHEAMVLCGTKSGRDTDKFAACGLTARFDDHGVPFIGEAEWVLICRKLYAQDLTPDAVADHRVDQFYQGEQWHRMYVGEVIAAYQK